MCFLHLYFTLTCIAAVMRFLVGLLVLFLLVAITVGMVCLDILNADEGWRPGITVTDIVLGKVK